VQREDRDGDVLHAGPATARTRPRTPTLKWRVVTRIAVPLIGTFASRFPRSGDRRR
jgi:hypothetical protein